MVLLIDNYDSFAYNLYQLIGSVNPDIKVIRNDGLTVAQIKNMSPEYIVLSPGPGRPIDAGICIEVIQKLGQDENISILGVCLGHQAICEAFGATVSYAKKLVHGKPSDICVDTNTRLFKDLPDKIRAARYHSLAAIESTMPEDLVVTARTADGEIMAVRHKNYKIYGVQFHPESILTPDGKTIIKNFLE